MRCWLLAFIHWFLIICKNIFIFNTYLLLSAHMCCLYLLFKYAYIVRKEDLLHQI